MVIIKAISEAPLVFICIISFLVPHNQLVTILLFLDAPVGLIEITFPSYPATTFFRLNKWPFFWSRNKKTLSLTFSVTFTRFLYVKYRYNYWLNPESCSPKVGTSMEHTGKSFHDPYSHRNSLFSGIRTQDSCILILSLPKVYIHHPATEHNTRTTGRTFVVNFRQTGRANYVPIYALKCQVIKFN